MQFFWKSNNTSSPVGLLLLILCISLALAGGAKALGADLGHHQKHGKLQRDEQGRVLVNVTIEDSDPYPFLLDTAASRTVVYRSLVTALDIEAIPFKSRRVMTATGAREMQVYRLGSLRALGQMLDVKETVAMPDSDVGDAAGILGVDLLRGQILIITQSGAILSKDSRHTNGDDWSFIKGRPVGYGSVAVTVKVGALEIPAIVDTGAGASVINRPALEALMQQQPETVTIDTATLSASGGSMGAKIVHVAALSIGSWQRPGQKLVSAQLPVFATYGASQVPAMILGADVLLDVDAIAVDFMRWGLHVRQNSDAE